MTRLGIAVTLLFSVLAVPSTAPAVPRLIRPPQEHSLNVSGNVYLQDTAHPAQNVIVQLQGIEGADHADAATNDSGAFIVYNLKPAVYTLSINVQGYQPTTVSVDMTQTSVRSLQIILPALATADSKDKPDTVSAHELAISKKAKELFDSGKLKLYEQNDPAGAIEDFQKALTLEPNYFEAEYQVAMSYMAQGKRDEAAANFQKSIDMSGDKFGPGYVGLGTIAIDRKDYAQGEKSLRRGVELSPDFWLAHYQLGRALFDQGHDDDAAKSAEQARSLAPNEPLVYRLLTNIHLKQKDYRAAEADIDAYLKLDPDSAAGRRAKELRELVAQKAESQPSPPTPASTDKPTLKQ
jgi:tetratricopeptide (TPR) repeat protein